MLRPIVFLTLSAVCLAMAQEHQIVVPAETPVIPPGKGSELFAAHCLICHSTEYITSQPRMPRSYWEGTVLKMKNVFGAPISEDSVQNLTDYLTTHFGKSPAAPQPPVPEPLPPLAEPQPKVERSR